MSKKFKNRTCVYCLSNPSTTGDHVFAREFFLKGRRDNLPQVPACESCNREKSKLEHYLTAVLPFGGKHADASAVLGKLVPDRLTKNQRLRRELAGGLKQEGEEETAARTHPTLTIPFEWRVLERLFDFIVRGLVYFHWGTTLGVEHGVRILALTESGEIAFSHFLTLKARQHVSGNLGDDTFRYEGIQGTYPELTVWRFVLYGGLAMAGDPEAPIEKARGIGAITARRGFLKSETITKVLGTERIPG